MFTFQNKPSCCLRTDGLTSRGTFAIRNSQPTVLIGVLGVTSVSMSIQNTCQIYKKTSFGHMPVVWGSGRITKASELRCFYALDLWLLDIALCALTSSAGSWTP